MISIVNSITKPLGLDNLKRNLVSLETDIHLGINLLCLVNEKNLYLEVRDFLTLAVNWGECLVEYEEDSLGLKNGKKYVTDKDEYVFLLGEDVLIPSGTITKLYEDYLFKKEAGFVAGAVVEKLPIFWVEDVYSESPEYLSRSVTDRIVLVDNCRIQGLLTKTDLYKEIFCSDDLPVYGELSYGIKLRRRGYQNYLDTELNYKKG